MISDNPLLTVPHRDPFLWVTRLMERNEEGTEGACELDVNPAWDIFKGHFPGNPIFPGVIQIEAAAQACLWIHYGVLPPGKQSGQVRFVSVEKHKFRLPVVPPMTLRIHGKEIKRRSKLYLWDVDLSDVKTGELVSSGSFWMYKDESGMPAGAVP